MVLLAALVSRVEALVVVSMLQSAGIDVYAGAIHHASVEVNSLALGGHRLLVPLSQHRAATAVLLEVLGNEEWGFSYGLRRAVLKRLGLWAGFWSLVAIAMAFAGIVPVWQVLATPLSALAMPVNPQGRGDYYLADEKDPGRD